MCGIVGAVAKETVVPLLMDGLTRLEYRGYDSAGIAVLKAHNTLQLAKVVGKVATLQALLDKTPMSGTAGIAHTRWATHGKPSERNAHPHIADDRVVLVHNGIIENHEVLRAEMISKGYTLVSDTDSEVVAWCIYDELKQGKEFLMAVQTVVNRLEGSYAICVMDTHQPDRIIAVRLRSPLVLGIGKNGFFLASDALALQKVSHQFVYLQEGDLVDMTPSGFKIYDANGKRIEREIFEQTFYQDSADKAGFPHFMLKEIFEQPKVVSDLLYNVTSQDHVLEEFFGVEASALFSKVDRIQIVACGTSYHAGLIGRLWIEDLLGIPCQVEIASEFRYRYRAKESGNCLFLTISQSGETADTLAALRSVGTEEYFANLAICNVPNSSLVRESRLVFMTNAGPEIGVCSTKSFTAQCVALFLLTLILGRRRGLRIKKEDFFIQALRELPNLIEKVLGISDKILHLAGKLHKKSHALFLGRGLLYPIAKEGALKLKEISYIHAEAYPAGELKHGPLALIDKEMPVIAVAVNDVLLDKLKSNFQEVLSRGGVLIVFATASCNLQVPENGEIIEIPEVNEIVSPIVYSVALQLLAYHIAVLRGTDVDQPRNLAKSVTVE